MIAGLTAANRRLSAVEPAPSGEPLAGARLGFLDPDRLAVVIEGDLVQRRRDILDAADRGVRSPSAAESRRS